jgi:hypothetical protein
MKRVDILKAKTDEKKNQDFTAVIKKDIATINSLKSKKELEILTVEESIDNYLSNPTASLDSQFLTLFAQKQKLNDELILLDKIKAEYL